MTEPGWYTDPRDSSQYRYWDGTSWTEAVAPGSAAQTVESAQADDPVDRAADGLVDQAHGSVDQVDGVVDQVDGIVDQVDGVVDATVDTAQPEEWSISELGDRASGADVDVDVDVDVEADVDVEVGHSIPERVADAADGGLGDLFSNPAEAASGAVGGAVDAAAGSMDAAAGAIGDLPSADDLPAAQAIPVGGEAVAGAVELPDGDDALDFGHRGAEAPEPFSTEFDQSPDVLDNVQAQLAEATKTMVVDVPDMAEAPAVGDVGVPGDGRSFSSPIDGFSPDQTSVVADVDLPAVESPTGFGDDRLLSPPPPAGGFNGVPTPGLPGPDVGTMPPPGGFDSSVGGPALRPGGPTFDDPDRSIGMPAPGPAAGERNLTPWIILGAIALAIVAVLAYLALRGTDRTSVDAIVEGQCFADFNQFEATEIRSSVSSADCDDAHALEVFDVTDAPYQEYAVYPGEDVITSVAFQHCLAGFEAFVGSSYEESSLDVWALYPTEGSWNLNDDREVVCMVGAFDQTLTTGTLEGSNR